MAFMNWSSINHTIIHSSSSSTSFAVNENGQGSFLVEETEMNRHEEEEEEEEEDMEYAAFSFQHINKFVCRRQYWQYASWDRNITRFQPSATALPSDVIDVTLSQVECDLAIVTAGMPRCGSKLQHEIIVDAARALGAEVWVTNSVVRYEANAIKRGNNSGHEKKRVGQQQPRILVLKDHAYDDHAQKLCRHHLLYTSHRNLEAEVLSFKNLNWVKTLSQAIKRLDHYLELYQCWLRAGAIDWRFEDFSTDALTWGKQALQDIADKLEIDGHVVAELKESKAFRKSLEVWTEKDSHANGFTKSTKKRTTAAKVLPNEWSRALRQRYSSLGSEYI